MVTLGTMSPACVPFLQETLAMACDNIQRIRADMGGTNVLSPLKWVIRQPVHRGHPRLLFVVTDGAVSNTGKVLELLRNHAFSTRWARAGDWTWLPWAALGWGFQALGHMENARRRGKNPRVLCFQSGVADFRVCLFPSKVQEG